MKIRIHAFAAIILISMQATSCKWISSFIHDEEVVAEAAGHYLYRSEVDAVVPKGLSAEDSTLLAHQFISRWASSCIYQDVAEKHLSEKEKDVTKELSEYRSSLLKYRYEKRYVNERLDTVVTDQEMRAYYDANPEKFVLSSPILKGRFLKISEDSPLLPLLKKKMSSSEVDDVCEADSIAYSSAIKFETWNDGWIDLSLISEEFGETAKTLLNLKKDRWIEKNDAMGGRNILYVVDLRLSGTKAPFEFCLPRIKDIIISNRKHELVNGLERDLMEKARNNGNFVIY